MQANITQLLAKEAEAREVIAEAEQAKKASTWSANVWIVALAKCRPTNCCMVRLSIIVGGFTPMSTGAMHLPITSRHR